MAETSPKKVVDYLAEVSYGEDTIYVPSDFAMEFVTFIKLVNGTEGEEHLTPVVHYKMLDQVSGMKKNILNMCSRGLAKTTIMGEYLFLYLGVYGSLPGFGKVNLALYVSDSMENGVKNMRKNLEYRWANSEFLQQYIPHTKFTDMRWEFNNVDGNTFIVKGYGAKALSLDTKLPTDDGFITIGECAVGDVIFGPDGNRTTITKKSEVFNRPMYSINLEDGRSLKVCEEHINSVVIKENPNNKAIYVDKDLDTQELLELPLLHERIRKRKGKPDYTSKENLMFVRNTERVRFARKDLPIDPYLLGLLLGDGSLKKDGSCVLHAHKDDMPVYKSMIKEKLGTEYIDKRNPNVVSLTIKGLSQRVRDLGIVGHGNYKFIPPVYLRGSTDQRIWLLNGLMDTDGSIQKNGRKDFCSNSEQLVDGVADLVRSLGGTVKKRKTGNAYRIEIWLKLRTFYLPRKVERDIHKTKDLVAITSIDRIADEPSQCIGVDNESHQFLTEGFFRTHNTGVRGSKEMGQRPTLAILDDLVSDEDARSATVIESIEATVYKAIRYALHPSKHKIIWSGTPFNARDPLYKAVESGAWHVNVYPVCEKFPCDKADFKGAWEDRFTYEYVEEMYETSVKSGKLDTFNQELMLRVMSDDDRLILDRDIQWYSRTDLLKNKAAYNFYITTDFATSEKTSGDYSVISVWAHDWQGNWFWVDGICKKQLMDKNIDDLFKLAQIYEPQSVGVEVSGQQGGFIPWIRREQLSRLCMFNLASDSNQGNPGIKPNTNKMQRFNVVVPLFKQGKMFFPEESKTDPEMVECMDELTLASAKEFKSKHDDFIDTISMLSVMQAWRPSKMISDPNKGDTDIWEWDDEDDEDGGYMGSYIV